MYSSLIVFVMLLAYWGDGLREYRQGKERKQVFGLPGTFILYAGL